MRRTERVGRASGAGRARRAEVGVRRERGTAPEPGHGACRAGALAVLALVAGAFLGAPSALEAQITWESPRLLGSDPPRGLGVYGVEYGALPGDDKAVLVTWTGGLPEGLRLRGGFGEGADGENAGFGGIDVWRTLTRGPESAPVDVVWTTGLGVGVGEWTLVSIPIGLTTGTSWSGGSVWVNPYIHAGVVLDLRVGGNAPEDEFEAGVATDLGVNVAFDRGRRVVVSASAGLGDRQAVAVGLVFRP